MSGRHGAGPDGSEPLVPTDAMPTDPLPEGALPADPLPEGALPADPVLDGPVADDPELDLLAALYATGSIEGEELVVFEARLATDPAARARVAELHDALAGVGGADEVLPPTHLKDAVMARLTSTAQVPAADASAADLPEGSPPEGRPSGTDVGPLATVTPLRRRSAPVGRAGAAAAPPRQNRSRPLVALLAAAAAAVLVLGIGAVGWTALQGRQQQQAVQAAVSRVADAPDAVVVTASSDTSPGWTAAHVVYSATEGRAAVVDTSAVPDLDGREYQLWFVTDEGVRSAGLMTSQEAGAVLEGDMTAASAVAVTVEPEGGSATPSGDPVAVFEMPTA